MGDGTTMVETFSYSTNDLLVLGATLDGQSVAWIYALKAIDRESFVFTGASASSLPPGLFVWRAGAAKRLAGALPFDSDASGSFTALGLAAIALAGLRRRRLRASG